MYRSLFFRLRVVFRCCFPCPLSLADKSSPRKSIGNIHNRGHNTQSARHPDRTETTLRLRWNEVSPYYLSLSNASGNCTGRALGSTSLSSQSRSGGGLLLTRNCYGLLLITRKVLPVSTFFSCLLVSFLCFVTCDSMFVSVVHSLLPRHRQRARKRERTMDGSSTRGREKE